MYRTQRKQPQKRLTFPFTQRAFSNQKMSSLSKVAKYGIKLSTNFISGEPILSPFSICWMDPQSRVSHNSQTRANRQSFFSLTQAHSRDLYLFSGDCSQEIAIFSQPLGTKLLEFFFFLNTIRYRKLSKILKEARVFPNIKNDDDKTN